MRIRLRKAGEPDAPNPREEFEDAIREARLAAARRNSAWSEIVEPVRRERFLVDAESDRLYRLRRGDVFAPSTSNVLTPDVALEFYVDRDGEVVFVERVTSPATWSDVVRRRVERGAPVAS